MVPILIPPFSPPRPHPELYILVPVNPRKVNKLTSVVCNVFGIIPTYLSGLFLPRFQAYYTTQLSARSLVWLEN